MGHRNTIKHCRTKSPLAKNTVISFANADPSLVAVNLGGKNGPMSEETWMMNAGISIKLSEGVRAAHKSRAVETAPAAADAARPMRSEFSVERARARPRVGEKSRDEEKHREKTPLLFCLGLWFHLSFVCPFIDSAVQW